MMDVVTGLRQVIQDAPVPELRVLQAERRATNESLSRRSEEANRRFEKAGEPFTLLQDDVNRRFEAEGQRVPATSNTLASLDGKMDVLLDRVLNVKEMSRLSGRFEALERQVAEMARRS